MTALQTLTLQSSGVHFAYLDSGAPAAASYTTIFTIQGIAFTAHVFQKVIELAPSSSIRIVAINRRDYNHSSPILPEDLALMTGSEEDKSRYLSDRGLELLTFIDQFAEQNNLPPISEDGKTGGVALLGWSLGCAFATSALANAHKLEAGAKERLSKRLRSFILDDPPALALGMPSPASSWVPAMDEGIPMLERLPFNTLWLTSYFDHDLSKRDLATLIYAAPSTAKVPSAYSMHTQWEQIVNVFPVIGSDGLLMGNLTAAVHENYKKAIFDKEVQTLFPHLKKSEIGHGSTLAFSIAAFWQLQEDDEKHGGGNVRFEMIEGTNHCAFWDYPAVVIEAWKRSF